MLFGRVTHGTYDPLLVQDCTAEVTTDLSLEYGIAHDPTFIVCGDNIFYDYPDTSNIFSRATRADL
jgi:hypothetical protein